MEVNISDFLGGIIYCVLQYAVGWTVYLNGDAAFLRLDSTQLNGSDLCLGANAGSKKGDHIECHFVGTHVPVKELVVLRLNEYKVM